MGKGMGIQNQQIHEECINKQGAIGNKKPLRDYRRKKFYKFDEEFFLSET